MDRATIKMQAKQLNQGNTGQLFVISLALYAIGFLVSYLAVFSSLLQAVRDAALGYAYSGGLSLGSVLLAYGLVLASSVLIITVGTALKGYFVQFVRGRPVDIGDGIKYIYQNGFQHFGRYFVTLFVTNFLIGLWALIPFVGWILAIVAQYRYLFVAQIIHDNPALTVMQARDISRRMTDGMKGELFLMHLSFIGWYLLCSITFGLVFIYVGPYLWTTEALYYENLRIRAFQNGSLHPQQFTAPPSGQAGAYGNPIAAPGSPYSPQYTGPVAQQPNGRPAYGSYYGQQPVQNAVPQQQPLGQQSGFSEQAAASAQPEQIPVAPAAEQAANLQAQAAPAPQTEGAATEETAAHAEQPAPAETPADAAASQATERETI